MIENSSRHHRGSSSSGSFPAIWMLFQIRSMISKLWNIWDSTIARVWKFFLILSGIFGHYASPCIFEISCPSTQNHLEKYCMRQTFSSESFGEKLCHNRHGSMSFYGANISQKQNRQPQFSRCSRTIRFAFVDDHRGFPLGESCEQHW